MKCENFRLSLITIMKKGKKSANEDKFIAGRITREMRRSNDDNQSI
jgi:hypothetical protein